MIDKYENKTQSELESESQSESESESQSDSESQSESEDIMEYLGLSKTSGSSGVKESPNDDSMKDTDKKDNPIILGIDLGTTNSCISIWRNGNCEIIPDEYGNKTVPSYVAYTNINRYVGLDAKKQKDINIENVFYEVKRLMGKNYYDKDVADAMEMLSYKIVNIINENDNSKTSIGLQSNVMNNRIFSPEEISSVILSKLKKMAENYLDRKIEDVVITVPAQFNDTQRQATKNAATIAGLNCVRIFHEPTAAALAYGMMDRSLSKSNKDDKNEDDKNEDDKDDRSEGITIMVYDFGGGTLDVSIMDVVDGCFDVMGSSGISYFGGLDFDNRLMTYCITKFSKQFYRKGGFDHNAIPRVSLQKLRTQCEQAKKILSTNTSAIIAVQQFYGNSNDNDGDNDDKVCHDLFVKITRSQFEDLCKDLFILSMHPIDEILKDCSMMDTDIDEVILVGGMTRVPYIRNMLNNRFRNPDGKTRVNCSINPDEAISVGAAIQGYMIATQNDVFESNMRLMDITPLTLGVEVMGGIMDIVIERNTVIPCEVSKKYSTDTDDIDSVLIKVYEGERSLTQLNTQIGEFELCNIPKYPRGVPEIEITFKIDSNGIVTVTAIEDETKSKNEITVNSNKYGLSSEQISQLVEESREQEMADEIHRVKKGCHYEMHDLCSNVITNISNKEFKLTKKDIEIITEDINNIKAWLSEKKYDERSVEDYEEALGNMKKKYGVLILHGKVERNDNIKAADSTINATTVYGKDNDDMEEELVQAFEKVVKEETGVDDGMTESEISELKELRSSLYDLCESVNGIILSDQMQITKENKTGIENIITDILIWWSSCSKPTKTDYVSKIDEINNLCNDLVSEYEKEGNDVFKTSEMYSEKGKPSEKLEKLCMTVLTMIHKDQIYGDAARITLLSSKAKRYINMVAKYSMLKEDSKNKDNKNTDTNLEQDEYMSLTDEQFEEKCAELIDEFNETCNTVYNTSISINLQKKSVVPKVHTSFIDYSEYKESDVVKNNFDSVSKIDTDGGTKIIDIIRRKQNEIINQMIEDQIQNTEINSDNIQHTIDDESEDLQDKHQNFIIN